MTTFKEKLNIGFPSQELAKYQLTDKDFLSAQVCRELKLFVKLIGFL